MMVCVVLLFGRVNIEKDHLVHQRYATDISVKNIGAKDMPIGQLVIAALLMELNDYSRKIHPKQNNGQ